MEKYIRLCNEYAIRAANPSLQANGNNSISSMYLARYEKTQQEGLLDSSYRYLSRAFALDEEYPGKVNGNTFVITCINLANYYLEFSAEGMSERRQKAFRSEEHTSELQSLMRISYAVFCLKKHKNNYHKDHI